MACSPSTQAVAGWKHRTLSSVWNRKWHGTSAKISRRRSGRCGRSSKSAAWTEAWWQLRHGYASQGNNQQVSFRGLARTVMKTCKSSELNTRPEGTNFKTSSLVARETHRSRRPATCLESGGLADFFLYPE